MSEKIKTDKTPCHLASQEPSLLVRPMRSLSTSIPLILYSVDALTDQEIFARDFCKAALASDYAFCDNRVGECSIRQNYADQHVHPGKSRVPCSEAFLQHVESRFRSSVRSIFATSLEQSFATVDGSDRVPMWEVLSSYSVFLRIDLKRLLIPSEILDDSEKVVKLIEMRVFCPTSSWFNQANLPLRYEDLNQFLHRVMDEPVLSVSTWKKAEHFFPKKYLTPFLIKEIGRFLGPTLRSAQLLTDESRYSLLTGRADPQLLYMAHNVVSRLLQEACLECDIASIVASSHRIMRSLGVTDGLSDELISVLMQTNGDKSRKLQQTVPAGELRWLYKLVSSANIGEIIGASERENLSHHMLISHHPNQEFLTGAIDQVVGDLDPSLPTKEEVVGLILNIPTTDTVTQCILETLIRYVAEQSQVGAIPPKYCVQDVSRLKASSVFAAIHTFMHNTTLESYRIFHRMLRRLPIMTMFRTALEQMGYHTKTINTAPFVDPRMTAVYDAFIGACTSLESSAKQYHTMFGRRPESFSW